MERLFIGIYPNLETTEKLRKVQNEIMPLFSGKSVETYNMHVTLLFIGMVNEEEKNLVNDHLGKVAHTTPPFVLSYNSIEFFPDTNNPKVVWVRVEDKDEAPSGSRPGYLLPTLRRDRNPSEAPLNGAKGDKNLVRLHEKLRQINNACLKERKDWAFIPHITLARIKEIDKKSAIDIIEKYKNVEFGKESIDTVSLVRSDLSPQSDYTILNTFKFKDT